MGIIQCKDVCKSFGEKVALDHVSLDFPQGKIFGTGLPSPMKAQCFLTGILLHSAMWSVSDISPRSAGFTGR